MIITCALSISALSATTYTNKTFLLTRPVLVDKPMAYSTFEELKVRPISHKNFGGNFQFTGFYYDSVNSHDLGKYFGINNKNLFTAQDVAAGSTEASITNDLAYTYLIHNVSSAGDRDIATISLKPEQSAYGMRIDYYENLDVILKGLFLQASTALATVQTDAKLKVHSDNTTIQENLEQFFHGDYYNDDTNGSNKQEKLTRALYKGRQDYTGVPDIDITLGYKFLNKDQSYISLALGLTVPTGTDADGVYIFEPILGNGQHWGCGANVDGRLTMGDEDGNISLHINVEYRYLFSHCEYRTIGIKNPNSIDGGSIRRWGQYHLIGQFDAETGTSLIPAANRTTVYVETTPGSQLDGIVGITFNTGGFSADLGYNLYARDSEKLFLKSQSILNMLLYPNTHYSIAARNFKTTETFGNKNTDINGGTDTPIFKPELTANQTDVNNYVILASTAATPSYMTHGLYGNIGYIFKEWPYPLMFALGAKYEWPGKNNALEQWNINGRFGVGF